MSIQKYFSKFHKEIRVETDELREKRDIIVDKIRASLKEKGHPLPEILNQGSYIYGVGVYPVNDEEYDIDVGLDFDILSNENEAKTIRSWVYDAIKDHTDNVEDRGPCIRVRYAAGYHVDLVIYARHKNDKNSESYQLAYKDNVWKDADPKKLKSFIQTARESFKNTKDSSGADQLQRVTRYLKRWNDLAIPGESDDKPFGLATLLLVIDRLKTPQLLLDDSSDIDALIVIASSIGSKISIFKPTPAFEDVYAKLSSSAMSKLVERFKDLLTDLNKAKKLSDEEAAELLNKNFGKCFPTSLRKSESEEKSASEIADMRAAIPSFNNPSKPHAR